VNGHRMERGFMTHWTSTVLRTSCLVGLAFLDASTSVASPQGGTSKSDQAEKGRAENKKVDVKVRVSANDGTPIPAGSVVEISGQESTCGKLSSDDLRASINESGEVMFRDLPACKVTVKINLSQYKPGRKEVDLRGYRSCSPASSGGTDGTQPPCEAVSLELIRLQ
jgi:hypothetical protein